VTRGVLPPRVAARRRLDRGGVMAANLRTAPSWVTPMLVERVLHLADRRSQNATNDTALPEQNATKATPTTGRNGKYPKWTPDEDEALRKAYAVGDRIDHLAALLGRTYRGTISRAQKLGYSHPRDIKGGFITSPSWTAAEDALLHQLYGNIPTPELPARIGRSKTAIFNRAFTLGLRHGYQRCWTRPELKALRIAHDRGLAIADVAAALGRKSFSVSKYAGNHGLRFGARRLVLAPLTLQDILALEDPAVPLPATVEPRHGRSRKQHDVLVRRAKRRERDQERAKVREQRAQQRAAERARARHQRELAKVTERRLRELERAQATMERARAAEARKGEQSVDRATMDRANIRRRNTGWRRLSAAAEAFVDAGIPITRATPINLKIAQRAVIAA
jgi:hypothetical protein